MHQPGPIRTPWPDYHRTPKDDPNSTVYLDYGLELLPRSDLAILHLACCKGNQAEESLWIFDSIITERKEKHTAACD